MNQNNSNPQWVTNIQRGLFDKVEEELTTAAAQRVANQHVQSEIIKLTQNAGPYARYTADAALRRAVQIAQQHNISDPQQQIDCYDRCLQDELREFTSSVKPGHAREGMANGVGVPSDTSVRDYCAERRAAQQRLKDEGAAVSRVSGNRG